MHSDGGTLTPRGWDENCLVLVHSHCNGVNLLTMAKSKFPRFNNHFAKFLGIGQLSFISQFTPSQYPGDNILPEGFITKLPGNYS